MVSMSGGAWSEISRGGCGEAFCGGCFVIFFEGGCFEIFCGGYLDITWHLLESCFTAFLRRAAFTAYFEAAFFAAFFRGSCFVAFFGGGCFAAFFREGCFGTFLEGGLKRPLRSVHIKTITGCCVQATSNALGYNFNADGVKLLCSH